MDSSAVATHYNKHRGEGRQRRKQSRIYRMRQFNNWLKSVLIKLHTRPGYSVLDLCCGKGGDLNKWAAADITSYVACDVAELSVKEAAKRYNDLSQAPFRPFLLVGDVFGVRVSNFLATEQTFDVVSCQFAIHYAFESEDRVKMLLRNVTDRLNPGGFFIGTTVDANVLVRKLRAVDGDEISSNVYRIKLDDRFVSKRFKRDDPYGIRYLFTLDQNVEDCPEFVVHFPTFQALALEYDLEPFMLCNFHDFYAEFASDKHPDFKELFQSMNVIDENGTMSPDEWDAIYLYTAFAFRKRGTPNAGSPASELDRKPWPPIFETEIVMMHSA